MPQASIKVVRQSCQFIHEQGGGLFRSKASSCLLFLYAFEVFSVLTKKQLGFPGQAFPPGPLPDHFS